MIDAVEAVVQYLRRDADMNAMTAGRVATKHKFGDGWPIPSKAIALRPIAGGSIDLYTARQIQRVDTRLYGESQPEAMRLYQRLVAITRDFVRSKVETVDGNALIYWMLMRSSPNLLFNQDLKIDYVLVSIEAAVAEEPVP